MKVLLVDDDAFLRDMYATKFIECGHEVEALGEASLALASIKEKQHDVVLLDMVMPAMTGLDLLKEVSKNNLKRQTTFIILSNQSETTDRSSATEAGADGYIVKAESIPSDVVKQVESICNSKKKS